MVHVYRIPIGSGGSVLGLAYEGLLILSNGDTTMPQNPDIATNISNKYLKKHKMTPAHGPQTNKITGLGTRA